MLVLEAVDLWERELRSLKGAAPRTVREHVSHVSSVLDSLGRSLAKEPGEVSLHEVSRDLLVLALDEYNSSPKVRSRATVARRLSALRSFFGWCLATGHLPADVSRTLPVPKVRASRPAALCEADALLLLQAAGESLWPERDRLLVSLLLTCGLRLSEAVSLRLSDVDRGVLRLADRDVPLSPLAASHLASYLPSRRGRLRRHGESCDALLLSRAPVKGSMEPTVPGMGAVVTRLLAAAGLSSRGLRANALRATFASLALESGSHTPEELASALGVSSPRSVARYSGSSLRDLAAASARHPLSGSAS